MTKSDKLVGGSFLVIVIAVFSAYILPEFASKMFTNTSGPLPQLLLVLLLGFILLATLSWVVDYA